MLWARDELAAEIAARQAAGETGVLTNGVFDLLHVGHLRGLRAARAEGDFLVVGLNSDASVRRLSKGPGRPLLPAAERAELLAALDCVDYVTLFDEDTATELAAALCPRVYVKSADYADRPLPERAVVEAAGGQVRLVPMVPGRSTSDLLARIQALPSPFRLVIVDRDGTLNREREGWLTHPEQFELLPGAAPAIARLNAAGLQVAVATNQSAVGRGHLSVEGLGHIHQRLDELLAAERGEVIGVWSCVHAPDEACDCRKPLPGLLLAAIAAAGCRPHEAVMVGDADRDLQAGRAAGCGATILVRSGKNSPEQLAAAAAYADVVVDDLAAAADWILARCTSSSSV